MYPKDNNIQGNLSTIILIIYMLISPYVESLGITQSLFSEFCFAILGLGIAIWSAYNPNTLKIFNNHIPHQCNCSENIQSDEIENSNEMEEEGC